MKNSAKAILVNFTPRPLETAFWAFRNMHNEVTSKIDDFIDDNQRLKFLEVMDSIPHQTVFEYINLVWLINGSRAFQQQLTRTRDAAYSIQSLRVVNVGTFADDRQYHTPPDADPDVYHTYMTEIQRRYNRMIDSGRPVEAARGILPLNINSPITMSINLRDLIHMLELRTCFNTQYEYRVIAQNMIQQIYEKIDKDLAAMFFRRPCDKLGYCNSPAPCHLVTAGKFECKVNRDYAKELGLK